MLNWGLKFIQSLAKHQLLPARNKRFAILPLLSQFPVSLTSRKLRLQLTSLKFQVQWSQTHSRLLLPSASLKKPRSSRLLHCQSGPAASPPVSLQQANPGGSSARSGSSSGSSQDLSAPEDPPAEAVPSPRPAKPLQGLWERPVQWLQRQLLQSPTVQTQRRPAAAGAVWHARRWPAVRREERKTGRVGKRSWMPCWKDQRRSTSKT